MSTIRKEQIEHKRLATIWRLALLAVAVSLAIYVASYVVLFLLFVLGFVVNELFFSDHLFYSPSMDYRYQFNAAERVSPEWFGDKKEFIPKPEWKKYDTALLAVTVEHSFQGKWLDPFIVISSGVLEDKQYLERSVSGVRFIDVSAFLHTGEKITLDARYCEVVKTGAELVLFSNPNLEQKKVLLIAPHADDAEIAAFGLYSSMDSFIFTVTAGEVGAQALESQFSTPQQASLLKGRRRAWESVAVPRWAGLQADHVVQAGYFCMQLKAMHDAPEQAVESKTAGVKDTRVFREFNQLTLASDAHGTPSWNALIEDLLEVIDRIKPDCILTPHLDLDPHEDHHYSTLALQQALTKATHRPEGIYLYANHLKLSDTFPFGPVHSLAALPPNADENVSAGSVVSWPLSLQQQKNKAVALSMMHDLLTPLRWKKKLRFKLQALFIGRPLSPYGEDEYFRKAIRSNELFFRVSLNDFLDS